MAWGEEVMYISRVCLCATRSLLVLHDRETDSPKGRRHEEVQGDRDRFGV